MVACGCGPPSAAAGSGCRRDCGTERIGALAVAARVLDEAADVRDLDEAFRRDPLLRSVVVTGSRGVRLVDRTWFALVAGAGGPGGVGARHGVGELDVPGCLVLDARVPVTRAAELLLARPDDGGTPDDVVVTTPGEPVRTAAVSAVFRSVAAHYARRPLRDPLTGLPSRSYLLHRLAEPPAGAATVRGDADPGAAAGRDRLVLLTDTERRITYVSDSSRHLVGFEPGAVVGTALTDHVHPDDHDRLHVGERVAALTGPSTGTFRVRRADGVPRWFRCRTEPVSDPATRALEVVSVCWDVTDAVAGPG
ncbi:PAS domain-containing protein [Kineococcus glutinatus]|uniref:PAS domain-containing protein n=1 Tax=Kineococcus glutinatus TaxID=1070872 RepID=UPI0031E692D7